METLNKSDIIDAVTEKTGQSKKDTGETIDVLLTVITDQIKAGKKVNFTGFGAFMVRERKGRTGHNPRTGEKLEIPATKVPKFKAGAVLKQSVK
jgi:DNA-binding protein HU-beta